VKQRCRNAWLTVDRERRSGGQWGSQVGTLVAPCQVCGSVVSFIATSGDGTVKRRELVRAIGVSALIWPLAASAQQRMRRVGVLMGQRATDPEGQKQVAALRRSIEGLGWIPGQNIEMEIRWHGGDTVKARMLATELIDLHPDLLFAAGTPSLSAVRQATQTIPIVFVNVADPLAQGFVLSLARPGGNITGFGLEEPTMGAKWVQLLTEIAPRTTSISVMFNPATAPFARMFLPSMEALRRSIDLQISPVSTEADIEKVIAAAGQRSPSGLIVLPGAFLFVHRDQIVALAARHRVPAIYYDPSFSASGGLLSYGVDRTEVFRRIGSYVDRILKGEKPANLPIQMPTEYRLVINLTTAKALGLDVSEQLQQRADEVIE
jgi:putative tryptophan/tyrosine transport system substrate-binding protein